MTGIKMLHIPYKAGNLALNDLLGGHVSLTFSTTITSTQFVQSGRLRGIAVTSQKRLPAFPDLPTVAESGVPGYEFSLWLGLSAPAGTPDAVIQRLYDAVVKSLQSDSVRNALVAQSVEPLTLAPAAFARRIAADFITYENIVKQSGASLN
jgi:tripartite-type tricarboxylate transporter receptor subunit TctC